MDELYALEREEALRRAEYEARHAEALRRAEHEARHTDVIYFRGRSSKSATTSPVSTPFHGPVSLKAVATDGPLLGPGDEPGRAMEKSGRTQRRMSGPAWQMTPMTRSSPTGQPSSLDPHVSTASPEGLHGRPAPAPGQHRPVHPGAPPAYRHLSTHEDSPSPLSSDSDSIPAHLAQPSLQASLARGHGMPGVSAELSPRSQPAAKPEFSFTPSTSPFLGPFRTLNLHSTNPSRAPSPILLPPAYHPHGQGDGSVSPVDVSAHGFRQRSRGSSIVGSPPNSRGIFGPSSRNKSLGDIPNMATLPHVHTYPGQLSLAVQADRKSHSLPTPQLSSGPSSSSGSSPGSSVYPLAAGAWSTSMSSRPTFEIGGPTRSPPISRPGSPRHASSSVNGHSHHPHHHHLAHSARSTFGMTPIHARTTSGPQRNTSWPNPQPGMTVGPPPPGGVVTSHHHPHHPILSASLPPSRAASPPITLPPLRLKEMPPESMNGGDRSSDDEDRMSIGIGEKRPSKVELPSFKEIEAAARAAR
ncbi:hypothetical protein ID866_9121 [Astraeus odoratus]|nr:hypothetical protein ID866_9121 [Astraeus odoratus]